MSCRVSLSPVLARLALGSALTLSAATVVADEPPSTVWSRAATPAAGPPRAIGSYSAGCVQGAQGLALEGVGYRVKRPERRRHFGHPQLIDFVQRLGAQIHAQGLTCLGVGDLGQVRGGPAPSGHASHQTGLDVDLWFADASASEPTPIVDLSTQRPTRAWNARIPEVLRLAASDRSVARIFVNPAIKQELCKTTKGDRAWLGKLRPWYGHHEHFHVRLECPADSPDCQPQAALPAGEGCAELSWWLSDETAKERSRGINKYGKRVGARPQLPTQCEKLAE